MCQKSTMFGKKGDKGETENNTEKKSMEILNEDWSICEDMTDAGMFL